MRLRHTAALGLAAGALVLSGGLAMADSSGGTSDPADTDTAVAGSTAAETAEATLTEAGTVAGGFGYGMVTKTLDGESFSLEVQGDGPGDDGPGNGKIRRMAVNGHELTDEQRQCLEDNGATPPAFKAGERPTREDMEAHRTTMEAAMDECGIEHPEPGQRAERGDVTIVRGQELTDEQRDCMDENAPKPPDFAYGHAVPAQPRAGGEPAEAATLTPAPRGA